MKLNIIPIIISVGISALIAYGFYNFHNSLNKEVLIYGSFIFSLITLICSIGINFEFPRTTANIKTVSIIFFAISLISNFVFTYFDSFALYIIVNGILFMIFTLIIHSLYKLKE